MADGDGLFALVQAYADLGDHRTGTDVDIATRTWFAAELERRGAAVQEVPYDFDRYVGTARLQAGGEPVQAVPLWYSGTGRLEDVEPAVASLTLLGGYVPVGLDEAIAGAGTAPALVLATDGGGGRLVAVNREPAPAGGLPVVLAPGSAFEALAAGPTRLSFAARLEPASSATVVGRLGEGRGPFVVTTPLSGWFRCAGERGTGVALTLELSTALAERHPVLVVGTTGHEIGHLGARHWLGHRAGLRPRAVLHLGASAAAGDGAGGFSPWRVAMTTLDGQAAAGVEADLEPSALPVRDLGPPWPGEGEEWRHLGVPLLSVTGTFEHFHTPDDVADAVTSSSLLAAAHRALLAASGRLA